jgi:uncharacterized glyoxalase superfamily protein PhnB
VTGAVADPFIGLAITAVILRITWQAWRRSMPMSRALASDWRKAGMEVVDPENQDYGKREGQHVDPDGNLIRFGGPPR